MTGKRDRRVGKPIPDVSLAELIDGRVAPAFSRDVLGRGRVLVSGVPGAFTPVCSGQHLPNLIANAARLHSAGFSAVICLVASDPFVVAAWAKTIDPDCRIRFLSDGNLEFARALGLISHEHRELLGDRSERYVMALRDGCIESLQIERSVNEYDCTSADVFVLEDA